MRKTFPAKLEDGRIRNGEFGSGPESGGYGAFLVHGPCGEALKIISSGGDPDDAISEGWEHVSVSTRRRVPNWAEMSFVKDLFFEDEECVVQYHPPKSDYVNNHPFVLHMWRNANVVFPMPPSIFVGIKDKGIVTKVEARELREIHLDGLRNK